MTLAAPASRRTIPAALTVPPVLIMSSTTRTSLPFTSSFDDSTLTCPVTLSLFLESWTNIAWRRDAKASDLLEPPKSGATTTGWFSLKFFFT